MIILGIDPGGVWDKPTTGFAVIDWLGPRRSGRYEAIWITGACLTPATDVIAHLLLQYQPELVAVERPGILHRPQASRAVLATADIGGDIGGQAKALGYRVVKLEPAIWKKPFAGKGSAKDKKVKELLLQLCAEVPKRTTTHARDAAGLAIVAGRMYGGRSGG